ncbi:hypothetical protein [Sporomusa sphaeroides]|nr:hypothetical protein [Sporomusa sphaeroides]
MNFVIQIIYWPANGGEYILYEYPAEKMIESEAYNKCIEIENTEPLLPNGIYFDYGCMSASYRKEEQQSKKCRAFNFGVIAFGDGKKAIPVLDKDLLELLRGNKVGEGLPIIKSWLAGWHSANILAN